LALLLLRQLSQTSRPTATAKMKDSEKKFAPSLEFQVSRSDHSHTSYALLNGFRFAERPNPRHVCFLLLLRPTLRLLTRCFLVRLLLL
jgi:hypothetical protein